MVSKAQRQVRPRLGALGPRLWTCHLAEAALNAFLHRIRNCDLFWVTCTASGCILGQPWVSPWIEPSAIWGLSCGHTSDTQISLVLNWRAWEIGWVQLKITDKSTSEKTNSLSLTLCLNLYLPSSSSLAFPSLSYWTSQYIKIKKHTNQSN